jgi:hypothetical protein
MREVKSDRRETGSELDVANVADGVMELVETVMTKITLFAIITQPKKEKI